MIPELVKAQYDEIKSLTEYYKVIQWMLHAGLLPEFALDTIKYESQLRVPYPANIIVKYYEER